MEIIKIVEVTNTIYLPNDTAETIKRNSGIKECYEPPGYLKE